MKGRKERDGREGRKHFLPSPRNKFLAMALQTGKKIINYTRKYYSCNRNKRFFLHVRGGHALMPLSPLDPLLVCVCVWSVEHV